MPTWRLEDDTLYQASEYRPVGVSIDIVLMTMVVTMWEGNDPVPNDI